MTAANSETHAYANMTETLREMYRNFTHKFTNIYEPKREFVHGGIAVRGRKLSEK